MSEPFPHRAGLLGWALHPTGGGSLGTAEHGPARSCRNPSSLHLIPRCRAQDTLRSSSAKHVDEVYETQSVPVPRHSAAAGRRPREPVPP